MEKQPQQENERDHIAKPRSLSILEFLAAFDPIGWFDAWFGAWWHRPWSKIHKRFGALGVLKAGLETSVGAGDWRFYIPRTGEFTGWETEKYLSEYGVDVWGRGFTEEYVYFTVKKEQANWAEYLLKRRGVAVISQTINPLNDVYVQRHPPGSTPRAGDKPKRHWWMDFWSGMWK